MIYFACDWCNATKHAGENWILGMAAESIGLTAARREINILTNWDKVQACHPLAVHFCSTDHKDRYMAALFDTQEPAAASIVETRASLGGKTAQRKLVRTVGTKSARRSRKPSQAKHKRAA